MARRCTEQEIGQACWIRTSTIQDAACLTLVAGGGIRQTAAAFGAVQESGRELDIDDFCEEAFAHQERYPMIAVRSLGDWQLVVDDAGGQCRRPEVLRRASARTKAVSIYWDVQGECSFSYAAGGKVRVSFEPALPEYREGTNPDLLDSLLTGLPWEGVDPVPVMLALAGRVTGLPATEAWLSGSFWTFPVAAWPDDPPAIVHPDPDVCPPRLAELASRSGPHQLRQAALQVARHVLARTDCLEHPLVVRTLRLLTVGSRVDRGLLDELFRQWHWESIQQRPASIARNQVRAVQVLRQATGEEPLTALLAVLAAAREVRGVRAEELVALATAALRGTGF